MKFMRLLVKAPWPLTFGLATGVGVVLGIIYHMQFEPQLKKVSQRQYANNKASHSHYYKEWLSKHNITQVESPTNTKGILEAEYLMHKFKVFCWVKYDQSSSHSKSTEYYPTEDTFYKTIMATWGRKCAKIKFFIVNAADRVNDEDFVLLGTNDLQSWDSSFKSIEIIGEKYLEDYDWFVKVEEDTFLILENILYYVSVFDPNLPYYLGYLYGNKMTQIYNVAGPGTILSQAAIRRLFKATKTGLCIPTYEYEDSAMARCLQKLGIRSSDTRDSLGRQRFLLYVPETHVVEGNIPWFDTLRRKSYFEVKVVCLF